MSLRIPITKERIRNHFQYSAWKYVLLVAATLLAVNLICTMTAYRTPNELKIEFYTDQYLTDNDALAEELMEKIHQEALPEMEEVTILRMALDETYGDMQLMTWISAGEGDVYLLDKEKFTSLASEGAMLDLQPLIEQGLLHVEGLTLEGGYVTDSETGARTLRGIPAEQLKGFTDYLIYPKDQMLGIMAASGNEENAIKFLDYLLTNLRVSSAPAAGVLIANDTAAPTLAPTATDMP